MVAIEYLVIAIVLYLAGCVTGFKVALPVSIHRNVLREQRESSLVNETSLVENSMPLSVIRSKPQLAQSLTRFDPLNTDQSNVSYGIKVNNNSNNIASEDHLNKNDILAA